MKKGRRLNQRKNFLPAFILAILAWLLWGWLIFSAPPTSNLLIILFLVLLFLALFLTTALALANSRRGLFIALAVVGFLTFRLLHLANLLNLLLLAAILICLELYLNKRG